MNHSNMMKNVLLTLLLVGLIVPISYAQTYRMGKGQLTVSTLARNAVRITYSKAGEAAAQTDELPDWIYVNHQPAESRDIDVAVDNQQQTVSIKDSNGRVVFKATGHQLKGGEATLTFLSPKDDHQYGLGQFQDDYSNVRGLSRRLTQVNTQIAIPMLLSSKGYGILWNNYGLTEFNPASQSVRMVKRSEEGLREEVNVTTTDGGKKEVRERHVFEADLDIAADGDYSLLLDVGQTMARRHNLCIDGKPVIDFQNLWLPPTVSTIVSLKAGKHTLTAELTKDDNPVLFYQKVKDETVFRSPIAKAVDYTVFIGSADEIITTYRQLTGEAPMMPLWALGYVHCRERFNSSKEILETASRFRHEGLPADVMVQDWQYWGKYGWNAMRFDETRYPDPKALTDSLHSMNMRLMVSVWSKIDQTSEVGRQMERDGYYIPGTTWIDFFNPDAAASYWKNFSERLVSLGIDAWWQDATEPENDDLLNRRVNNGRWPGELVRNVYPLLVSKTVGEGLLSVQPDRRPMILTRSAFPGIQRYGSTMWSGDVGNDWATFRRQLVAGLGMQAAGIPWWTYDAGGFFRPANQYTNKDYIQRMMRWIETSVYLPVMRVHGYQSNTEPWCYGEETQQAIAECLRERYQLIPYIYSGAAAVTYDGSTLMRPLVFDFADDAKALQQKYEFMFGKALLVSPVIEADKTTWDTYLPRHQAGWYDFRTNRHYEGAKTVTTDARRIPVFVRGGSILPLGPDRQYVAQDVNEPMEIRIYPGADATFTLYEDDGISNAYKQGQRSLITFHWDNSHQRLTIDKRQGGYEGMPAKREFRINVIGGKEQLVGYIGKKVVVSQ